MLHFKLFGQDLNTTDFADLHVYLIYMAHTLEKNLLDLKEELHFIRSLSGVVEKKTGIFYYKSIPFLHFHDKEGRRWAHVKIKGAWVELDADFDTNKKQRMKFVSDVKRAHALMMKGQLHSL
jgi:hypothetical protein